MEDKRKLMSNKTLLRFQAKYTVLSNGCWQWNAAKTGRGYGVMDAHMASRLAHRIAYEHFVGSIPNGLTIDHLCRNKACVNPMHLEPVTNRVNNLRGDSTSAHNARKTHCPNGHEYTLENTYMHRGCRHCRTCHRLAERQRKNELHLREKIA